MEDLSTGTQKIPLKYTIHCLQPRTDPDGDGERCRTWSIMEHLGLATLQNGNVQAWKTMNKLDLVINLLVVHVKVWWKAHEHPTIFMISTCRRSP